MLKIVSKSPPAFVHRHLSYAALVDKLAALVEEIEPRPFGFKSVKSAYNEHSRFILPAASVFASDEIRPILKNWTREVLPEFMQYLGAEVLAEGFKWLVPPQNVRLALRFRILQDRDGYSLAPHKDSADTLFAFLLQLDKKNPCTSLYLRDKRTFVMKTNSTSDDQELYIASAKKFLESTLSISGELKITDHQFGIADAVIWEESGNAWQIQRGEDKSQIKLTKYDAINIELSENEILGIHNPLKDLVFTSAQSRYWQSNCCHGFYPRAKMRPRNVMLFDLMMTLSKDDRAMVPAQDTDDTYYVMMEKETSLKLLDSAGLMKGI
ncbi:MAG: hypothetical protein FJY58_07735 [Betaproteobacteria bacterium]|nr:hypothetical protein [Betaproteobacteria bacterium]